MRLLGVAVKVRGNPRECGGTNPPGEYWVQVEQRGQLWNAAEKTVRLPLPESQALRPALVTGDSGPGTVISRKERNAAQKAEFPLHQTRAWLLQTTGRAVPSTVARWLSFHLANPPCPLCPEGLEGGRATRCALFFPYLSHLSSYANASHPSRSNLLPLIQDASIHGSVLGPGLLHP